MTERYPSDEALLAIESDAATGVEMIPTGASPYYLQFRRLVQRLLLACTRANDLRVYEDGDLTFGVRPGSCVIADTAIDFAGVSEQPLDNNVTTTIWLDGTGTIQTSTNGLPSDRTAFVPLARVATEAGAITSITDLRGQGFLLVPDLGMLGVSAAATEIDQAMAGINPTVTAAALNDLTGGIDVNGDGYHRHERITFNVDAETYFTLANDNEGSSATVALRFHLPNQLPFVPALGPDLATGWLRQNRGTESYALVGVMYADYTHEGELTASTTGKLMGAVPIAGQVSDVILSVGTNIVSDDGADGVSVIVRGNGTSLTSTDPAITDNAGAGFRSTARGDGTPATVKSDGTEQVSKGDVLTVDLARTANGTVTQEAADVVVLVVIRAALPE